MGFSTLDLHPALAAAISARGYEQPTDVQRAVLEATCRDRDLLVSAQTGSGKTLAFGALLARGVLDPGGTGAPADGPSGLVIAPTRELAEQVRSELGWLFARTPLRVSSFTGGSDIRRQLKLLQGRIDVVVGTPGRLVDLLSRGSLSLAAVRIAVLDEADEMLDMGFREDLEKLLDAASARTQTHMFSATLPRPILGLAARYQRNAARVDVRAPSRKDGTAQHQDIDFVEHLIGMGDRLAAVVNVLTRSSARRAIVFGTTRMGVGDLHQELESRGIKAVALSGDRAQAERNRALDALRRGDARVLVATNVAARGLDIPEVDLIVHADLPLDVEALTHRSGRTGRAGRRGTSVIIATIAERRKAERLLEQARIPIAWTAAPGAAEIRDEARIRMEADLLQEAADLTLTGMEEARAAAERLAGQADKDGLLAALLRRELGRLPAGEEIQKVDLRRIEPIRRLSGPPIPRAEFTRSAALFRINLGARNNAEPGWLLPLICRRGGVTRREVGAIRVGPEHSEFEIFGDAAADFALSAAQPDPRALHVQIERMDARAQIGAPRDGRHPPRRPPYPNHPSSHHPTQHRGPQPKGPWTPRRGKPGKPGKPVRPR